jgi:hypothetical protein
LTYKKARVVFGSLYNGLTQVAIYASPHAAQRATELAAALQSWPPQRHEESQK